MNVILTIILYFIMMNLFGFLIMGIDKYKAIKRSFRIPESALFMVAVFGGSLGTTLGMFSFRHKTRHWYFLYGMPAILFLQLILFFLLYNSSIEFIFL